MAKFSRFTPEAPEEEMEVDGDSVKLSGRPSKCLKMCKVKCKVIGASFPYCQDFIDPTVPPAENSIG